MHRIATLAGTRIGSTPQSHASRARSVALTAAFFLLQAPDARAQGFLHDYVVIEDMASSDENIVSQSVPCPAGLQVLGGGVRNLSQGLGIVTSEPGSNRWVGRSRRFDVTPALVDIEVMVICGRVESYSRVEEQSAVDSTSPKADTVSCPQGTSVLGGGVDANGSIALPLGVTTSAPSGNGWFGRVDEVSATEENWSITVHAVCGVVPNRVVLEGLSALNSVNSKNVSTFCPVDLVPISGGAQVFGDTREVLSSSFPSDPLHGADFWTSSAFEPFVHLENWNLRTSVICAPEPHAAGTALAAVAGLFALRAARRRSMSVPPA